MNGQKLYPIEVDFNPLVTYSFKCHFEISSSRYVGHPPPTPFFCVPLLNLFHSLKAVRLSSLSLSQV